MLSYRSLRVVCTVAVLLAVGATAASWMALPASADPPAPVALAWVSFHETLWCPASGDSISGTVQGDYQYSVQVSNQWSGPPLWCVTASLLPAPGVPLNWIDYQQAGSYQCLDGNGAFWAGADLEPGQWQYCSSDQARPTATVDSGLTVTRVVPTPVLTLDSETVVGYLDIRLNHALDASINRIDLNLWQDDLPDGVSMEIVEVTVPPPFMGGNQNYSADPAGLTVGVTYRFAITYRVTRTGEWAVGSCYFKPAAAVSFHHREQLSPQVGTSVALSLLSGARVRITVQDDTQFNGETQSNRCELNLRQIIARVGPASMDSVFLIRGREVYGGTLLYQTECEITGENLAGVSMTTPTGKVVQLYCDDPGDWWYEFQAADAAGLADFPPGVYTFRAQSTDGSPDQVTQVDTSDLTADPAEFPVITSPAGDSTNRSPTLAWNAPTDPNINMVRAEFSAGDEDEVSEDVLPIVTWIPIPGPLDFGGYEAMVAFTNSRTGTTAEGVDYWAVRFTGVHRYCNVTPFTVTASLDDDWVYQNTLVTTADRHHTVLHLGVTNDPSAPQAYGVQACDRGGAGSATVASPASPLLWTVTGGRRASSRPGSVSLDILVRGNTSDQAVPTTISLTQRLLGDIDGDGAVTAADKLEMNKSLNGLANLSGIGLRELDLTGDGTTVNAEDKLAINQILNGVTVP